MGINCDKKGINSSPNLFHLVRFREKKWERNQFFVSVFNFIFGTFIVLSNFWNVSMSIDYAYSQSSEVNFYLVFISTGKRRRMIWMCTVRIVPTNRSRVWKDFILINLITPFWLKNLVCQLQVAKRIIYDRYQMTSNQVLAHFGTDLNWSGHESRRLTANFP